MNAPIQIQTSPISRSNGIEYLLPPTCGLVGTLILDSFPGLVQSELVELSASL